MLKTIGTINGIGRSLTKPARNTWSVGVISKQPMEGQQRSNTKIAMLDQDGRVNQLIHHDQFHHLRPRPLTSGHGSDFVVNPVSIPKPWEPSPKSPKMGAINHAPMVGLQHWVCHGEPHMEPPQRHGAVPTPVASDPLVDYPVGPECG